MDTTFVMYRACALEGFGEARPPQDLYFLVVVAGKAGNDHQKEKILGGYKPSKPPSAGHRVTPVMYRYAETAYTGGLLGLDTEEQAIWNSDSWALRA